MRVATALVARLVARLVAIGCGLIRVGVLAALGTVFVVVGFLFIFETTLAADGRGGRGGAAACNRFTCSRVGDRNVGSGRASTCSGVGIGEASGGIAGSASASAAQASAAQASAAHTHTSTPHTHTGPTTGVDNDMGYAPRMTSDNLTVHGDGGHPAGDVGCLLALGLDTSGSRELVPVSELQR
jgi:hypothetical protein